MGNTQRIAYAAAIAAALAALGAAQAATDCRPLIGIDTLVNPPTVADSIAPPPTAWTTVDANSASFLSRNTVEACSVKVVITSAKGKPTTKTLDVPGPMTQDECSLYQYLSSIDSKLVQKKFAEAYTAATATVAKVDNLGGTAKLVDPGYAAIRSAAVAVQTCVAALQ